MSEQIVDSDVEEVDHALIDLLKFVKDSNQEIFENAFFENFTTYLSDKTQVELKKNGRNEKVGYDERFMYIELVLKARLMESQSQMEAIKKGIMKIIPESILHLIKAKDMEVWICGKSKVDFDLLKKHTSYSGDFNDDHQVIKWFWELLFNMKESDKLKFVKFCWGQERLPATDEEYERTQTRFMVKMSTYDSDHDRILPKADTCFFNIQLPVYTSFDILQEKITIAIHIDCDSMNAEEATNDLEGFVVGE